MDYLGAIGDGFSSFFSIWQVCILQISPFFLAYVIGLYFAAGPVRAKAGIGGRVLLPAFSFIPGFAAMYALLTMTGLSVGRAFVFNLGTLEFIAGSYILLAALALLLAGRITMLDHLRRPAVLAAVSLLLGIAFALIYSPCITPALSKILGLAGRPETAVYGGTLALFYATGICLALTLTGAVLVYLLARIGVVARHSSLARGACALVLGVLAGLNLSGTMIYYKAFFLGFLVG
ncbi:MAG: cytochrome c biogenesis protein CcdA [Alphaproteobacteria bacterium]|jgi:cytochrome c-type biogenesis protein|nr:cytochrome c biogenesis protein CcdA [Alphaproteobacteria bacterium]MDP6873033.1 cytochrome c biogenesis protein CcdA [Alphaproteobacteria bacterium]